VTSSNLDLKVIAIHDNPVGANVSWGRRTQDLARQNVVLRSVPWTRNDHAFHFSLRQGSSSMRTRIADSMEFTVGIENSDPLSSYIDRDRLT
jgi:hypothetical protein